MMILAILISFFTFLVVLSSASKFSCDWDNIRDYFANGDVDHLSSLREDKWLWIRRHFICAVFGVAFICFAEFSQSLEHYDLLAKLVAVHVAFSLIFVFVESLFILRISGEITSRMKPVKAKSEEH
jgi:hypothetical protein